MSNALQKQKSAMFCRSTKYSYGALFAQEGATYILLAS